MCFAKDQLDIVPDLAGHPDDSGPVILIKAKRRITVYCKVHFSLRFIPVLPITDHIHG